jgi:AraC-like DNA-binding protein
LAEDPLSDIARDLIRRGVDPTIVRAATDAARAQWGGCAAYIHRWDREARDQRIEELLNRGVSAGRIAREVGVHPATVRRKRSAWF